MFNLSTGRDHAKLRWQPAESVSRDFVMRSPAGRERFLRGGLAAALRRVSPQSLVGRITWLVRRRS